MRSPATRMPEYLKKDIWTSVDMDTWRQLRELAHVEKLSISELVARLIRDANYSARHSGKLHCE